MHPKTNTQTSNQSPRSQKPPNSSRPIGSSRRARNKSTAKSTKFQNQPLGVSGQSLKSPKASKLSHIRSRGPANPNGKLYQRSEKAIRRALLVGLSRRCLSLQARNVFRAAQVAAPTFYSHAKNVDAVLINCETDIEMEFVKSLPTTPKREMAWTILLGLMGRNRDYFRATAKARNHYLLEHIIKDMRHILDAAGNISEKSYLIYTANAIGILQCWIIYDHFDKNLTDYYVKKLMQLRFMRF